MVPEPGCFEMWFASQRLAIAGLFANHVLDSDLKIDPLFVCVCVCFGVSRRERATERSRCTRSGTAHKCVPYRVLHMVATTPCLAHGSCQGGRWLPTGAYHTVYCAWLLPYLAHAHGSHQECVVCLPAGARGEGLDAAEHSG